jgi:TonB family protein
MKNILSVLLTLTSVSSFSQNDSKEHDPKLLGQWEFNKVEITFRSDKEREAFNEPFYFVFFEDGNVLVGSENGQRHDKWHTQKKDELKFELSESTNYSLVTDEILLTGWENTVFSMKKVKCNWEKEQVLLDSALAGYEQRKKREVAAEKRATQVYTEIDIDDLDDSDDEPEYEGNQIFEVFDVSEKVEFPGGEAGLKAFIDSVMVYPLLAKENDIQGSVNLMFVIGTNGAVEDVKILGSRKGFGLEEEAIRIINRTNGMWKPATRRDKPVKMRYRIPVRFEIKP